MFLNCFHLSSAIQGASPQDSWPHMAAGLQYVPSWRQPQVPLQKTQCHRLSCAYCHQGCAWWGKTHSMLSLIAIIHVVVFLLIVFCCCSSVSCACPSDIRGLPLSPSEAQWDVLRHRRNLPLHVASSLQGLHLTPESDFSSAGSANL